MLLFNNHLRERPKCTYCSPIEAATQLLSITSKAFAYSLTLVSSSQIVQNILFGIRDRTCTRSATVNHKLI